MLESRKGGLAGYVFKYHWSIGFRYPGGAARGVDLCRAGRYASHSLLRLLLRAESGRGDQGRSRNRERQCERQE
jgi:hypothetical protein